MGGQRWVRPPSIRELIELEPAVDERMTLKTKPDSQIVASYVLTRGAERALEATNARANDNHGAIFWIGGPAGGGKTHFLNYTLALENKSSAGAPERSQRMTLGVELTGRSHGADLETQLLEAFARGLPGSRREAMLWREMRGPEALSVALDQSRRFGIAAVIAAIDFGDCESDSALAYFATLAQACESRQLKFTVIAAGRGRAPSQSLAFDVAPADGNEQVAVAIGRARRLVEAAESVVEHFYRALDTGPFEPRVIFPFHPLSIEVLRAIASPPGTVAEMARLVRDVLAPNGEGRIAPYRRLIAPADLLATTAVCARVESRLGESGRAALKIAHATLEGLSGNDRKLARQIIDTLVLAHFGGGSGKLRLADLRTLLPAQWEGVLEAARTGRQISGLLETLAGRSKGTIRLESDIARFDPRGAGAPEVGAFNAALPLVRRFDSTITAASELPELKTKLKRLSDAMANALEAAHRTRETLAPVLKEAQGKLPPEGQTALPDYIALASGGPDALLEAAADPARRERALKTIAAYDALAGAAGAAPRLWAMRDYLEATGLAWSCEESGDKDTRTTSLESQCQLLGSQLNPAVLLAGRRNLDALQARFQQFRWSYVQEYRIAHERWRAEMKKLAGIVNDARRHFDALRRLNSINGLGAREGETLEPLVADMERRVVQCDFDGPLSPEVNPRCPRCGFVLGTPSPERELSELFEQIRSALRRKLAALSRSAIARLIREHDRSGRLEGFLRITQAAQTDALVRVLDDDLTRYVASLIDENLAVARKSTTEPGQGTPSREVVRRISGEHPKAGASKLRS